MSSVFVSTPLGNVPKQENFKVAGIFNTGFLEFDKNIVYLNINDALSLFDKETKDQNIELFLEEPLEANHYKKNTKN